jgi:DNA processing protein
VTTPKQLKDEDSATIMKMQAIRQMEASEIPPQLLEIPQPPEQLFIEGELPSSDYTFLTVVGSRRFSGYGREVCEELISGLKGYPIVVVSGLALGIDTIAHKRALKCGIKTIAFPGSGLDREVLHPHSNRQLADDIVAAGGALVSEFDPEMPAGVHTFPRRNRLMAGLSKAVLIIEAGEKSGTLITARLATEYNRDVLVVPGSIFSPSSSGNHMLLRLGATPITKSEDILESLGFAQDTEAARPNLFADLSPNEQRVVDILSREALERDILIEELELSIGEANALLMTMEIKGLIKESLGEIRIV